MSDESSSIPASPLCVDANLVVRFLTDPDDVAIQRHWRSWRNDEQTFIAPFLFRYEVTNALYRLGRADKENVIDMTPTLHAAFALPIELYQDKALHAAAMKLASRFNLSAAYDAHYLALADNLGVEFWTADKKLANPVRHSLPWVHLIES
ncbi:MAG: type II toxin-antitoxin system VapC family toxin [Chloroflexia bacterium]|nr:type II toxin-antitoxin system VapC family toxin [Chloroflexia bacterium]